MFNRDIKTTVAQCGELSEFINIERGCHQGDPISSYIVIMAAQILTILIKFNKDIKGIMIGNTEFKLVQFADNTTLILNGTVKSLQAALNILVPNTTRKSNSDKNLYYIRIKPFTVNFTQSQ